VIDPGLDGPLHGLGARPNGLMRIVAPLKLAVRAMARRVGYEIVKSAPQMIPTATSPYGAILVWASYSPWACDPEFCRTYDLVRNHTLVDRYRCFELWSLVEQAAKLEGALMEVGVWRGGTGTLIGRCAQLSNIEEPVYLCDTFTGVVKATERDAYYVGGEHADASREGVEALGQRLNLDNLRILEGVFPEETARLVQHQKIRFCHVDVDVYESAAEVVAWVWPRLVIGGIVVYDDYGFPRTSGVITT
jgi:O-methyltransferase